MGDSTLGEIQLVFTYLNGLLRTSSLYLPAHPQTRKARQTLFQALSAFLDSHGKLDFRFLGDLLVANERILPRESLVYRRFIDTCQTEKGIGSLTFTAGLEEREIDAVLEALTEGPKPSLSAWASRRRLIHVFLGPPVTPDRQSGEAVARRAYAGSVETLRDMEATIRSRAPLTMEQFGTLRVFTSAMLEQILQTPGLALRLASIKSYDEYTLHHSVNVAVIAIGLGVAIGLGEPILRELAMAGVLHDLGKIAVPLEILRKPGLLEEDEWRVMRRHPVLGADLLSRMPGSNRLPMIVAFEHHMRFDMKGYPFIREGWIQHPVSRLACMADVFDAMTSRRAYKKAIPTDNVRAYVRDEAGRTFDPRLVAVLDQMLRSIHDLREEEAPRGVSA